MTVRIGVIGMGFMGRTHVSAYQGAQRDGLDCKLVAVCDRDASRLTGKATSAGNLSTGAAQPDLFDPAQVKAYTDPKDLLSDPGVDLVSICTHTDTHVGLVIEALRAGKHVVCEKPVSVDAFDVSRVAEAAYRSGKLCMPAMCMRFWPGWALLKELVRTGEHGAVVSASFSRLGSPPDWAKDFYADVSRTGGPLVDLHIHDADIVHWLFGTPTEVSSTGTLMHVTTQYRFEHGPAHVVAEGGQDQAPGFGFSMRYVVNFERATVDFDLSRSPTTRLSAGGTSQPVRVPEGTGYDAQARHIVQSILLGRTNDQLIAPIDDAVAVAKLLEAERRSLETGRPEPVA